MKKILVVDVGGTNVKILATGQEVVRKIPSGPQMTARYMAEKVLEGSKDWEYEVIAIGYPGPVVKGQPILEPVNLAPGWVDVDFVGLFGGKPVKVINDAAMQALGSYEGGRMLFLGLGTGLGTAMILDKVIAPMELGHLPYKKKTFEDYVGTRGLVKFGKKKWQAAVEDVVARLQAALVAEEVVLGGGNAKKLKRLPPGVRMGDNKNAFLGGYRLWDEQFWAK
jgi:polyphosphate glucokinase